MSITPADAAPAPSTAHCHTCATLADKWNTRAQRRIDSGEAWRHPNVAGHCAGLRDCARELKDTVDHNHITDTACDRTMAMLRGYKLAEDAARRVRPLWYAAIVVAFAVGYQIGCWRFAP